MVQSLASNTAGSSALTRSHMAMDMLPLVARIFISGVFFISGFGKITAPAATIGFIASVGLPFPQLGLVTAILVETVVTAALVLGYRIRTAATILHFWKNMAMAGGLMQIIAFGGGRFSLDARRK